MNSNELTQAIDNLEHFLITKEIIEPETAKTYEDNVDKIWLTQNGAQLCAKAWLDPEFKEFLLKNGKAAAESEGYSMPHHHGHLVVLENTALLQNVICCSLCSCTAFTLMGLAPSWYKDLEYRSRVVREARTVLSEMGLTLAENIKIKVWDTTTDTRYMVLPMRPENTEHMTLDELASLITQDALIGVSRLEAPYNQTSV